VTNAGLDADGSCVEIHERHADVMSAGADAAEKLGTVSLEEVTATGSDTAEAKVYGSAIPGAPLLTAQFAFEDGAWKMVVG